MNEQADNIIAEARKYLGTRWVHQGRDQRGLDCCGFIVQVALGSRAVSDVRFEFDYRRQENGQRMLALLLEYMDQVELEDALPGDVLALCDSQLKHPEVPTHLMILTQLTPYWAGIHASEHGVREHRLDILFKRRIHSVWRTREDAADGIAVQGTQISPSAP